MHNFGLSDAEMLRIREMAAARVRAAQEDPLAALDVWGGDYNFLEEDDVPVATLTGLAAPRRSEPPDTPAWREILAPMAEWHQPLPTHFLRRESKCSRLDRLYCTSPSWVLRLMSHDTGVVDDPVLVHGKRLSDHTIIKSKRSAAKLQHRSYQPFHKNNKTPLEIPRTQCLTESSESKCYRPVEV